MARMGVEGAAREIARRTHAEHREAMSPERGIILEVQARGGVRRPQGMSAEEWRNRLPRALHHRKRIGPGVAVDELAQEFADRYMIADAYGDTLLDFLARTYAAAAARAPVPGAKDLRREARKLVDDRAKRTAAELARTARRQAELSCSSLLPNPGGSMRFKKGSPEARAHMAKLRAMAGRGRSRNAPRTGTIEALRNMAAAKGLSIDTWSPGDGVTRYRFFPFPNGDYYAHSHKAVGTVKGLKAAFKFVERYGPAANPPMLVLGNPASGPADEHAATELDLFISNDADLYRQQYQPIIANLMRKRAAGKYDREKAVKLFMYLMESGAKKYIAEFGSQGDPIDTVFNKNTRELVARWFRDRFEQEAELGNYDQYIPKKYRKNPSRSQRTRLPRRPIRGPLFGGLQVKRANVTLEPRQPNPPRRRDAAFGRKLMRLFPGMPAQMAHDPAFQAEVRAYRRRHGSWPGEVRRVKVPKGYPRYMSAWGESPAALYDAPSHSNKGRRIHHFGEGRRGRGKRPYLVSSAERGPKFLAYVGGNFKAGGNWIRH